MVGPTSAYDYDEAAAKKRRIEEMAFGGADPGAADPVEQALYGRFPAKFRPRRLCNFYEKGQCSKGIGCTFAHSLEELHPEAQTEQEYAVGNEGSDDAEAPSVGLSESNAPSPGEEVSFLSLATGPREFENGVKPKALCRFFLHHPTYCLQGDSCQNAHGLSELGLDDKSVSIKSSTGPIATVSMDGAAGGGGKGKEGKSSMWGFGGAGKDGGWAFGASGKGKEGKSWWDLLASKGGFGMDKGGGGYGWYDGPYAKGGGCEKGGACDKGKGKGKGDGKGCSKGKGDTGGKMALTAGEPMQSRFGKGGFKPTRMCTFWLADPSTCRKGADCTFAHGVQELQPGSAEAAGVSRFLHTKPPTKMCTFFGNNACSKGLACTFAHDEFELLGAA